MERISDQVSSIVVLENGAGFPQWVAECQRAAPNSIVIAQSAASEPEEFAIRAMTRIRDFTRSNQGARVAIMVCNHVLDAAQLAARYRICRCLIAGLDRLSPSELVLAVGDASETSRHAILSLAGDLCEVVGSTSISVRVRFFGERHTSGTMPTVSAGAARRDIALARR
jgi:hypothetical protein